MPPGHEQSMRSDFDPDFLALSLGALVEASKVCIIKRSRPPVFPVSTIVSIPRLTDSLSIPQTAAVKVFAILHSRRTSRSERVQLKENHKTAKYSQLRTIVTDAPPMSS